MALLPIERPTELKLLAARSNVMSLPEPAANDVAFDTNKVQLSVSDQFAVTLNVPLTIDDARSKA